MQETKRHPGKISKLAWPIAAIVSLTPGLLSTPVLAQGIEEIVVTAQRREQALQDVPITISAFSAEDLPLGCFHQRNNGECHFLRSLKATSHEPKPKQTAGTKAWTTKRWTTALNATTKSARRTKSTRSTRSTKIMAIHQQCSEGGKKKISKRVPP